MATERVWDISASVQVADILPNSDGIDTEATLARYIETLRAYLSETFPDARRIDITEGVGKLAVQTDDGEAVGPASEEAIGWVRDAIEAHFEDARRWGVEA